MICIGERFIDKPFSYLKHCHDSNIVEGHRCSDMDNEEG
jgi:hypothetical protein